MPIPAYANFNDFPGSCQVSGREDMCEIVEFHHHTYIPVDVKDSTATATRRHDQVTVVKVFDKASPKLYECVWNGKVIPKVEIHWYAIDNLGQETEYFTHTFENVRIVSVKPHMPNVDDPQFERYKHMEEVGFRYEKITVAFVDGNIEASDSWLEGR